MTASSRGDRNRTFEQRLLESFLSRVAQDPQCPAPLSVRLRELADRGEIRDVEKLVEAIRDNS